MTIFWYILIALVLALLAWFLISLIWGKPWSINLHYARTFLRFALDSPELLTHLGILEKMGLHFHNAKLADASVARETKTVPPDRQRPAHFAQLRPPPAEQSPAALHRHHGLVPG